MYWKFDDLVTVITVHHSAAGNRLRHLANLCATEIEIVTMCARYAF